jgi:hypothetical protein
VNEEPKLPEKGTDDAPTASGVVGEEVGVAVSEKGGRRMKPAARNINNNSTPTPASLDTMEAEIKADVDRLSQEAATKKKVQFWTLQGSMSAAARPKRWNLSRQAKSRELDPTKINTTKCYTINTT